MHEEALLRDLLKKVEEVAHSMRERKIVRIRILLGALSHLTESQLRGRWGLMAKGTAAEGAALEVQTSTETDDPRALGVVLTSLDVEGGDAQP